MDLLRTLSIFDISYLIFKVSQHNIPGRFQSWQSNFINVWQEIDQVLVQESKIILRVIEGNLLSNRILHTLLILLIRNKKLF